MCMPYNCYVRAQRRQRACDAPGRKKTGAQCRSEIAFNRRSATSILLESNHLERLFTKNRRVAVRMHDGEVTMAPEASAYFKEILLHSTDTRRKVQCKQSNLKASRG